MLIYTMAIDNSKPWPVTPRHTGSKRIEVRENYNSTTPPTADLIQYDETDSAGANGGNVAKGTSAIYTTASRYVLNVPAGYIKSASGSITVMVIEHENI